jgi:hypothetical protein
VPVMALRRETLLPESWAGLVCDKGRMARYKYSVIGLAVQHMYNL